MLKGGLGVMSRIFKADIGSLAPNIQETQQVLGRGITDVANAADGHLIENNERNIQHENLLKQLSDAVNGLREEMIESRNNNQQIQETQVK